MNRVDIERHAAELRRAAGATTLPIEILPALSHLGLELDVARSSQPSELRREPSPTILIDADLSRAEQRYAAACELWHFLEPDAADGADAFAIGYLMPAQLVDQHFWSHRRVEDLAQLFLVDVEIMARRLAGLELLRFRIYEEWERETVPRWLVA